jgi:hypothetical protein
MRSRVLLLISGLTLAVSTAAQAQPDDDDWVSPRYPTGGYFGGSLTYARPQGQFSDFVEDGWGGDLHYIHSLDPDGIFGVRVNAGIVNYGHERFRVPLSETIGGRVLVDVTTSNNIAFLGVGPHLGVPDGSLRPYAHGFAGVSYLYTSSSVAGTRYDESFASTTNFDDVTFAWGGGAGVYVPLRGGVSPISLDLGLSYRNAGRADYLREGDIQDNPDGSITLFPNRSDTDLLAFHVGVTVGISR